MDREAARRRNAARSGSRGAGLDVRIGDEKVSYRPVRETDGDDPERTRRVELPVQSKAPRYTNRRAAARRPKRRTHFGAFFAVVIFAGVVISIAAFALMMGAVSGNGRQSATPTPAPGASAQGGVPIPAVVRDVKETCLIKGSDSGTRTLTLYGIMSGKTFYMAAANSTAMTDNRGGYMAFEEFRPGDVVDVVYPEGDGVLKSVSISPLAQTFVNVGGVKVDPESGKVIYNNKEYIYGQELVCISKGEAYDPALVSSVDRVTLRVYRNVALFIGVTTGHGAIEAVYNDLIKNASIEIGKDVYARLDASRVFDMPEGAHKVVVKGDNIETFQREVSVINGETVTVDLKDVQMLYGFLSFTSNTEDVYLTVNDQPYAIDDVLSLEFGSYAVRAEAFGYVPFERAVELNQPAQTVAIEMSPVPTPTPRPVVPETVRYEIKTNVAFAEVYIDGEYIGRTSDPNDPRATPLTIPLELGVRTIRVSKEGYVDYTSDLIVTDQVSRQPYLFYLQPADTTIPLATPPVIPMVNP